MKDSPKLKRKNTPVAGKKRICTGSGTASGSPVAGRTRIGSSSGSTPGSGSENRNNLKSNLITNHFRLYSSAQPAGDDGQAGLEAAGVQVGRDERGGGAVQGTRAKLLSGLRRGGEEGSTEQLERNDCIGPDRSAEDIPPNTGGRTIQLIKRTLQRGNGKNNSR